MLFSSMEGEGRREVQCIKSGGYPLWPYRDCSDVFEADDDMTQSPNSVEPQEGRGSGMVQKQNQCLPGVPLFCRELRQGQAYC